MLRLVTGNEITLFIRYRVVLRTRLLMGAVVRSMALATERVKSFNDDTLAAAFLPDDLTNELTRLAELVKLLGEFLLVVATGGEVNAIERVRLRKTLFKVDDVV